MPPRGFLSSAAGSIAGFAILFYTLRLDTSSAASIQQIDSIMEIWVCVLALAVSALMVSRIPYPHVVNQIFRGQRTLRHLVGVIFGIVAVMAFRGYSVSIVCVTFAFYGPVRYAWELLVQKKHQEERIL